MIISILGILFSCIWFFFWWMRGKFTSKLKDLLLLIPVYAEIVGDAVILILTVTQEIILIFDPKEHPNWVPFVAFFYPVLAIVIVYSVYKLVPNVFLVASAPEQREAAYRALYGLRQEAESTSPFYGAVEISAQKK